VTQLKATQPKVTQPEATGPKLTRRTAILGAAAGGALSTSGCVGRMASNRAQIDARVDEALSQLYSLIPGSEALAQQAKGMLVMPRVNEASFIYGANYGEGALMIGGAKVDYFSLIGASVGFQAGAQRYRHVLFFMTPAALADFRTADGWELGVDAEYAIPRFSGAITITSGIFNKPVYALIYGQQGLMAGASIEGNKYSRIVR